MRITSTLTLILAMRVVAQTASTEPDAGSELSTRTISTQSNSLVSDTPTPTISDPGSTEFATGTSTSTTLPPTGTSPPPIGGGATCVQSCLAEAAAQAGCKSSVDVRCICQSGIYISTAQSCFSNSACDNANSQSAIGDYGTVCRNGNGSNQSSRSVSSTLTRTKSYSGSLASPTTQTFIVTSGAVITLPSGSATTITSGFTTTRTGQAGDFATGGAVVPDPRASNAPSNGAIAARSTGWKYGGILTALGVVGGALIFAS
ncbi:hypothetical protein ACGC1H_005296 [Rhizoctonia solani]|uniref:CFEM domain-containing protein n=1 Tax=Rhizoctonia solani TaxID=456999 RepID=A0A8H3CDI0_9AGAM|nr:unnamed protein product [Rhizoctonia solani]